MPGHFTGEDAAVDEAQRLLDEHRARRAAIDAARAEAAAEREAEYRRLAALNRNEAHSHVKLKQWRRR